MHISQLDGGLPRGMSAGNTIQPRQNPLDAAHNTLERARELVSRIENLADRLVGSVPEASGSIKSPACELTALLDTLREHAETVSDRLTDGMRAVDRIERLL